jgi:catechol 2,3-dioxygenase-like lactoylglutathione lyase family enzyme
MIDHVTVQVADVQRSRSVYEALLAALGAGALATDGDGVGFCNGEACGFWLVPAERDEARELHLAFKAANRTQVHDFYSAAIALGLEVLYPPQVFEKYDPYYFAAFVRDPDGHNIEAVCRTPPNGATA